jgi:hypothetical protein
VAAEGELREAFKTGNVKCDLENMLVLKKGSNIFPSLMNICLLALHLVLPCNLLSQLWSTLWFSSCCLLRVVAERKENQAKEEKI